ncbi:MAG: endonuclease Q family protein [Candidatus Woesearchaeota archaeon]
MEIISDLHLHSKYSRACSKDLNIENMEKYAKIKGINLLGTGDFQHPKWIKELKESLNEDGSGILRTKNNFPFILTSEISLIYSQAGKGRKIHNIVWVKSFDVAEQVSEALLKKGRIDYDGRPIFGMSCPEFTEIMKEIDDKIEIIPAHVWTPWFGLFGSNSGFNSVEEAFQEKANKIYALETGLSSDPEMNWRLSKLDRFSLVSFSDSHSYWPWRLGRETTIFDFEDEDKFTYDNIIKAIRTKQGLKETIEVDPGYGKYHYDGHRNCNFSVSPEEAIKLKNICPKCRKPLTIGVEHRVNELADRPYGFKPKDAIDFKKLLPLSELISAVYRKNVSSKFVWETYYKLVGKLGSEFDILRKTPIEEIERYVDKKLAEFILKNRNQEIKVIPGYDGNYGIPVFNGVAIKIDDEESNEIENNKNLNITSIQNRTNKQKGLEEFF